MKVDAEGIAERHRRSFMENALAEFVAMDAPLKEADWAKVRGLEFRAALGERDELVGQLAFFAVEDETFEEDVSHAVRLSAFHLLNFRYVQYKILHGERVLQDKISGCVATSTSAS